MSKQKDYVLNRVKEALEVLDKDASFMFEGVRRDTHRFNAIMDFVAKYEREMKQLNTSIINRFT
jgi:hypothetical protein